MFLPYRSRQYLCYKQSLSLKWRIILTGQVNAETELCPLCGTASQNFFRQQYFGCPECGGIFMIPHLRLSPAKEKARYETHNNDVTNPGYQKFVEPIVSAVLSDFSPEQRGLDFGAGPGPVISCLLHEKGFNIVQYDPFFADKPELLQQKYDYIVCCEVIEHFYQPAAEFRRLRELLVDGGRLFCMTMLYDEQIDFARWFYKNDETHVFFYRAQTLAWIERNLGFRNLQIKDRLIDFTCFSPD
ncbi:MAG: methyltransferase [Candidatus Riflebacteria bacterium HGW-Riflebacteria-2]|nr:MAG: methyltransferase [Candidatus Riflebacteria bacterium HGW-Riflebacteria-2]